MEIRVSPLQFHPKMTVNFPTISSDAGVLYACFLFYIGSQNGEQLFVYSLAIQNSANLIPAWKKCLPNGPSVPSLWKEPSFRLSTATAASKLAVCFDDRSEFKVSVLFCQCHFKDEKIFSTCAAASKNSILRKSCDHNSAKARSNPPEFTPS